MALSERDLKKLRQQSQDRGPKPSPSWIERRCFGVGKAAGGKPIGELSPTELAKLLTSGEPGLLDWIHRNHRTNW